MKLKFNAIQILVSELLPDEMGVIYLMGLQKEMPTTVTTTVFTNIITFLCRKLDWIETEEKKAEPAVLMIGNEELTDKIPENTEQPKSAKATDSSTGETIEEGQNEKASFHPNTSSYDEEENPRKSNSPDSEAESKGARTMNDIETCSERKKEGALNENIVCSSFNVSVEKDCNENSSSYSKKSCVDKDISKSSIPLDMEIDGPEKSFSENSATKLADNNPDLDMACFEGEENEASLSATEKPLNQSNTEENIPRALGKVESTTSNSKSSNQASSFSCKKCDKTFSKESYLSAHVFIHHEIKKEQILSSNSSKENCPDEKPFSCSHCDQKFTIKGSLIRHQILHTDKAVSCLQCDKKFPFSQELKRHLESHAKGTTKSYPPFKIRTSGKMTKDEKNERRRNWALKIIQSGKHSCSQCPKKGFRDISDLKKHEARHAKGGNEVAWVIPTENYANLDKREKRNKRDREMRRKAIESGKFSCSHCDRKCGKPSDLKRHEETHIRGTNKDISKTDSTDKKLDQKERKSIQEREMRRKAIESGKFSCSHCDRKCGKFSELKRHEESHLRGTIKDNSVNDETDKKLELNERRRIRDKEKRREALDSGKFSCSHCGKKFGSSKELKIHEERHAKGATKEASEEVLEQRRIKARQKRVEVLESGAFSCCHCGKRFRENRELDRHEKLHTGERPFMCCLCGKAFIDAPRLKRHEIKHINDKKEFVTKDTNNDII